MNDHVIPSVLTIKPSPQHSSGLLWAIPGESRTFKHAPLSAEASRSAGQMVALFPRTHFTVHIKSLNSPRTHFVTYSYKEMDRKTKREGKVKEERGGEVIVSQLNRPHF